MNEGLANGSKGKRFEEALKGGIETGPRVGAAEVANLNIYLHLKISISRVTAIQDEVTEVASDC